jgi:nucleoside-diphosphate-sugar epimerase
MNILVTGGAGFIGHHVVHSLEQAGHNCCILDNRTTYGIVPKEHMTALHEERKQFYSAPVHAIDLGHSDADSCDWIMKHYAVDTVVHLASYPRQKAVSADPALGAQVMMVGLMHLLEAAKKNNVKRFVYVSSSMVYGDFISDIDEDHPCNPIGQYGIMKLAGEWLVKDYARRTGMEYVIIRPSAVYGPRDIEDRVVSKFLIAAMQAVPLRVKGEKEMLDFTYVTDAVAGIVGATLSKNTVNKTYNITRSASHTLHQAAILAIQTVGKAGHINFESADAEYPSRASLRIDRARTDFGYEPKVDIEQGFELYYKWLKTSVYNPI